MADRNSRGDNASDQVNMGKGHQLAVSVLGKLEKKKEKEKRKEKKIRKKAKLSVCIAFEAPFIYFNADHIKQNY